MRKFEILSISLNPGGPGPDRIWDVQYRAIRNKVWIEDKLMIVARNEAEARRKAMTRFGGKT